MKANQESTCVVIAGGEACRNRQGLDCFEGVCAQTAGSRALSMHKVNIPPLARAKPHLHAGHESAIYVLSGEAGMWYGEGLREHVWVRAGDFAYIPANTPHLPYNASAAEPCIGLVARTDADEQESVTMLDIPDPGIAR